MLKPSEPTRKAWRCVLFFRRSETRSSALDLQEHAATQAALEPTSLVARDPRHGKAVEILRRWEKVTRLHSVDPGERVANEGRSPAGEADPVTDADRPLNNSGGEIEARVFPYEARTTKERNPASHVHGHRRSCHPFQKSLLRNCHSEDPPPLMSRQTPSCWTVSPVVVSVARTDSVVPSGATGTGKVLNVPVPL